MRGWLEVLFAFALVFAVAPAKSAAADTAAPAWSPADLETFVDGVVAQQYQQHHLAGTVVTVVRDGQIVLAKGYGYADLEHRTPADPYRTGIRPGSISKLFTWTAVMQLAAEGRLDLDADLNRYLTAFKIPEAYGKPVTMRQLMTHSAGFDDAARGILVKITTGEFVPLEQALKEHLPARVRAPGVVSSYSNYGAALAGYVVQVVSGEPYESYMQRHVLGPLAMDRSTFVEPVPAALPAELAEGYYFRAGRLTPGPFEYIHNFAPTGSMTTTAGDMAHFMIAHLQNGRYGTAAVLSEPAAIEMHTRAFAHDPRVPGMALGFYEMTAAGRTLITHKGRTSFFMSQVALLPEERLGIFVSNNSSEGGAPAEALIRAIVARYFAQTPPAPRVVAPDKAPMQVAGAYRTNWHAERTWEKAFMLGRDVVVSRGPSGDVVVSEEGRSKAYRQAGPGYYVNGETGEPLVVRADANDTWLFRGNPVMALYKLRWFETSQFHLALLAGSLALFAGLLVASIVRLVRRGRESFRSDSPAYLAVAAGAVELVFVGWGFAFLNSPAGARIVYTVPPVALTLTWLPVLGLGLAIASLAIALARRRRSLRDPLWIAGVAGVALFSFSVSYWNLLGPHFR